MQKTKVVGMLKKSRRYIGYIVIVITLLAFGWYLRSNPEALDPLKSTPLYLIPILVSLYFLFLVTNFMITAFTITMSGKSYPYKDSFMLTVYSTLVNFFGPLQSGPGFRAVYLKKKIGLSIKSYTLATSLYYGAFLLISLLMMFGFSHTALSLSIALSLSGLGFWFFRKQKLANLLRNFSIISLITLLQLLVVAGIYYLELSATGASPSVPAVLAYTGSANLALFVSFTPGAIGIRESFIIFSQNIHGIPTEQIVSASLLDRSVYVVFLGLLFVLSSSMHIGKKLRRA